MCPVSKNPIRLWSFFLKIIKKIRKVKCSEISAGSYAALDTY